MKRKAYWLLVVAGIGVGYWLQFSQPPRREPASIRDFLKSCVSYLTGKPASYDIVEIFLSESNAKRESVNDDDLTIKDFFPGMPAAAIHLSQFNSLGDTYEHSELIAAALRSTEAQKTTTVMDFFCGSSIPTLRILAANPQLKVRVESIDFDADAIRVSRENAKALGFLDRYDFHVSDAVQLLNSRTISDRTLVALNPPYVPIPRGLEGTKFVTVDGGEDGTKFLLPFLQHPFQKGTLIAMTWSSLSNPALVIGLIRKNFEVVYVQSYETEFGTYTSSSEVLPYLLQQRTKGLAFFKDNGTGKRSYTIIGAVLRKK